MLLAEIRNVCSVRMLCKITAKEHVAAVISASTTDKAVRITGECYVSGENLQHVDPCITHDTGYARILGNGGMLRNNTNVTFGVALPDRQYSYAIFLCLQQQLLSNRIGAAKQILPHKGCIKQYVMGILRSHALPNWHKRQPGAEVLQSFLVVCKHKNAVLVGKEQHVRV